ncbi:dynamin family protein [Oscillatoria sp. FACHB-1406]|uniref:dynamin family protein n=1 Tax=Oscillatoria sp. FACHB-1406 TaxID=2692846 RepID=UPI00168651B5|nr:dynamin family protein [Oscillatoria sp. FACHB-1406]MBD2576843.1 dynamin family protein [Oscillatoria sp. FACHB-1406]
MDTLRIGSEVVELLSRITGQKLNQRDITPTVLFLANLITLLLGVIFADGQVTEEEKRQLQKTLNQFIPLEGSVRQLTQLMLKGVREQKIYTTSQNFRLLTAPLSEPEKLLLIGLGYKMSAADGNIDKQERKYLQVVSNLLSIDLRYLSVLESGFTDHCDFEPMALNEVRFLLDPTRFHKLEPAFLQAASQIIDKLPKASYHENTCNNLALSHHNLERFKSYLKCLETISHNLLNVISECTERKLLSPMLTEEAQQIHEKSKSQRFRLSVVGEFSQGKSTLLNVLLGEEIQPVRAIPCSGVVTVLKYGKQKRVVCCYRDGREEEIPFDQYQEKATISEEVALEDEVEELLKSELVEIVLEHPDLDMCRYGVEIVDSPGLNEHPARTMLTQQLLKETDAVIFLTNASRPLTEGERNLIHSLRIQLNGGRVEEPTDNLFIVVNFIDLLRREKDFQDVKRRIEKFVYEQQKIVREKNRVHYISAQAALEAILEKNENDFWLSFKSFSEAVEEFLSNECGIIKINQLIARISNLSQYIYDEINRFERLMDSNIENSDESIQVTIEKIGEISGRDTKLKIFADDLREAAVDEIRESWDNWLDGLLERLAEKAENWTSEHSAIWSKDKLIKDYVNQFNQNLSTELESWIETELKQEILKPYIEILDREIHKNSQAIKHNFFQSGDTLMNSDSNWIFCREQKSAEEENIMGGVALAGLGAALFIPAFIFAGPILGLIGSLFGGGLIGKGIGNVLDFDTAIRVKVFESGWQQFSESSADIEKINEIIGEAFDKKVEQTDEIMTKAIAVHESRIAQQEKAMLATLEQRELEKAWLEQKRQELDRVRQELETVLSQLPR